MRLKHKSLLLYGGFFATAALLATLADSIGRGAAIGIVAAALLVLAGAQFAYLKCPHCGGSAIFAPTGIVTPWTGDSCRHCGREY
jgi:hypothetical protein